MDPLTAAGLAASIIQIITATLQTIQFLNDVKDAPKDRAKLVKEAANLLALLTSLQYRMEEANPKDAWYGRLLSLGGDGGPLDQYKQAMENLAERLEPKSGIKDLQKRLNWTFDKKHIKETLDEIERLKALISLALQEDNFELSLKIKQDIREVGQDVVGISQTVADLNINQNLSHVRHLDEKRQAVISWLSPLNFSTKHNDVFNRRQNGTGRWLLEAEEFRSWLSGDKRTLWCPGLPGGGKTILTSIVVNYLEQTFSPGDAAVIYIYNSYKEHDEQSATNLVGSLLQQVVRKKSVISDGIMTMYQQHLDQRTRPSLSDLSSALRRESKDFTHVFILVDALDECAEANGVRGSLLEELRGQLVEPNTRLMITSRFITGLEYDPNKVIFLEIRASDDDVKEYLHCRISKERRLARHVERDEDFHDAIIKTIVNNAEGMFLLAQLHLDSLAKKHNKHDVRVALQSLPRKLDSTYDEAMDRICSQPIEDIALAKRVLSWISYAKRPLTVLELQHALAVELEVMDIDEEALTEEDLLVSVCVGLVTIEEESSIIRLVHFTTQEYFECTRHRHFATAEIDIALSCLTYTLFDGHSVSFDVHSVLLFLYHKNPRLQDRYPLLPYVVTYWAAHTRGELEKNRQVQRLALQLLEYEHEGSVVQTARGFVKYPRQWRYRDVSGLSMAASANLITITTSLLDRGARMEDTNPKVGRTALHYAADYGHDAVIKLLLERGAQIDARTLDQETALMLAAKSGHQLVVQMLLEKGATIEAKGIVGQTPLNLAAMYNKIAVMASLLASGADINTKDVDGDAPINSAVKEKNGTSMIQLLLDRGVDIGIKNGREQTPLGQAVSLGSNTMVRLLLGAGADINARQGGRNDTVLFMPVYLCENDMVQSLLDAGIDIHIRDDYGQTALFYGTDRDNGNTTSLLLQAGADINMKDSDGRTALSAAASEDKAVVVQLLLKAGADVDTKDDNGRTALLQAAAARTGTAVVVQLLLKAGADVNTKDNDGKTVLFAAAEKGAAIVVQLLLKEGADVDTRDNDGRTGLHALGCNDWIAQSWSDEHESSYDTVLQLLLKAGVEINARDDCERTALHIAAEHYYLSTVPLLSDTGFESDGKDRSQASAVQSLLDAGADFDARDKYGKTALHIAAGKGITNAVRILLEAGAEFDAKDELGRTALHHSSAVEYGRTDAVQLLLDAGAEIDARDVLGETALYSAAERGRASVVQFLLKTGADHELKAHDEEDTQITRTPLEIAVSKQHWDVAELLSEAGQERPDKEREGLDSNCD